MSAPLVRHGWTIAFQPQLFARQYAELKAEVKAEVMGVAGQEGSEPWMRADFISPGFPKGRVQAAEQTVVRAEALRALVRVRATTTSPEIESARKVDINTCGIIGQFLPTDQGIQRDCWGEVNPEGGQWILADAQLRAAVGHAS